MGRVKETADLIKEGRNPFQIAEDFGVTLETVLGYVDRAVGDGILRRKDIYFSFTPKERVRHAKYLQSYAGAGNALGDMYEDIRRIEVSLHSMIRQALVAKYGSSEAGWWRKGVPEPVRIKCQTRRETDPDAPCEAYCYTDLLDLGKILESNWVLFNDTLASSYSTNRRQMREDLNRLNGIRNKIMHPVRGMLPCEDDFYFVRDLEHNLGLS